MQNLIDEMLNQVSKSYMPKYQQIMQIYYE